MALYFIPSSQSAGSFVFVGEGNEFVMSVPQTGNFTLSTANTGATGATGIVTATFPLEYDSITKSIAIAPYYATEAYVNATFQPIAGMSAYLTQTLASQTYYPLTNPAGFITNAALSGYATEVWVQGRGYITSAALTPYLLTSVAASTYQLIGDYATNATVNALDIHLQGQIDGKQPIGDYATNTALTNGLATKQPVGDYATNTALTNGLATKANTVHTHTIAQVDGLTAELAGKQPVGDYATNLSLSEGLAGKADVVHTHDASAIVSGTIDLARIPVIPSQVTVIAAEDSITLLTPAEQAQITGAGVVVVLTNGERWIYKGTGSKTDYASYIKLSDVSPDWTEITNKPSEFPPSYHTHPISEVIGLQTELDGKNPLLDQSLNTTDSVSFANVTTASITIPDGSNDLIIDESGILFTDGTLQNTAGVSPASLSTTLSAYLTTADASSTYQPLSGMSDYLTVASASATYYPLTNPDGFITAASLSGYATESWVTTNFAPAGWNPFNQNLNTTDSPSFVGLTTIGNVTLNDNATPTSTYQFKWNASTAVAGVYAGAVPIVELTSSGITLGASPANGSLTFSDGTVQTTAATSPDLTPYAQKAASNTFTANQIISVTDNSNAALRITQLGTGDALRVEDAENPDSSAFVINAIGDASFGSDPLTNVKLNVQGNLRVVGTSTIAGAVTATVSSGTAVPLTIQNNGTGNSFVVNDEAGDTSPFIITADGNVGVGRSPTAGYKLDVAGNLVVAGSVHSLTLSSQGLQLTQASGSAASFTINNSGTGASFRVNDEASDTTPFIVDASGNVGVKRASPAYDLDVNGTVNLSTLRFGDGTTMTTAASANPFDQDLNTTDSVQFQKTNYASTTTGYETITAEAGVELSEFPAGFQVKDSSSGTISTVSLSGFSTTNGSGTFASVEPSTLASQGSGGVYVAIGSSLGGLYIYDPSTGGGAFGFTSNGLTFSNGTTQTKAYPFSGAVATAIEGGLLNSNSPSSTNAFATLGDVESSVNAYAASVLPVLPTTDQKGAMAGATLPSASNPFLTATALPVGTESASGVLELASKTEVETPFYASLPSDKPVSAQRAVDLIRKYIGMRRIYTLQGGLTTQSTGTGAIYTQVPTYANVQAPNALTAGFTRGYTIILNPNPNVGSNNFFSNYGSFNQTIFLNNSSTRVGTRYMQIIGAANAQTAGVVLADPTAKTVGWSFFVGENVKLCVHDGTTLRYVDSGYAPPANAFSYLVNITVEWDGLGNATLTILTDSGVTHTCSSANAPVGAFASVTSGSWLLQISTSGTQTANGSNASPQYPVFTF